MVQDSGQQNRPQHRVCACRVYEERNPHDGRRILVDRLWPRGLRKDDPRIDAWHPEVAPSTELRRWYGHRPERFDEFCRRYEDELIAPDTAHAVAELQALARVAPLTLLTATRDVATSHLVVLARLFNSEINDGEINDGEINDGEINDGDSKSP